jgi:Fe-S cluster assembly iron-binding protein IscA
MSDSNFFTPTVEDVKSKFAKAKSSLDKLSRSLGLSSGNPWPQTKPSGYLGVLGAPTKGFLPPVLIPPLRQVGPNNSSEIKNEFAPYNYIDWRGHFLTPGDGFPERVSETKAKFNRSLQIPSTDLKSNPYSTRDYYAIFTDYSTDYFKHGLQVLNDINSEFSNTYDSKARLGRFKTTPYELTDPVMFGCEIIIDALSSPLLNGSVIDFIDRFGAQVSEISSKKVVYEEFKQQFVKLFKTKGTVFIDNNSISMTGAPSNEATTEANLGIFAPGKKAYMSYYLKKITGIDKLAEGNSPSTFKYLSDYRRDVINLEFTEDVSLSVGTLAHLYKLLYWSKPNGKSLIPDNLLRFNCDIIVSEVRNFNRVRKAVDTGNIEVIKDNVSRYVYSLKECQFYFKSMPHPGDITMGGSTDGPSIYGSYNGLEFDYKYSTVRLEKWVEGTQNSGKYVTYNNGSIWKIGNPGARGNTGTASSQDISQPRFFTTGTNPFQENGVDKPFVVKSIFETFQDEETSTSNNSQDNVDKQEQNSKSKATQAFEKFKSASKEKASQALKVAENTLINSATRELQSQINVRVGLLNATINKILDAQGLSRISPPRNIYTEDAQTPGSRIFYDVRGDLLNFLGSPFGTQFARGNQTITTG